MRTTITTVSALTSLILVAALAGCAPDSNAAETDDPIVNVTSTAEDSSTGDDTTTDDADEGSSASSGSSGSSSSGSGSGSGSSAGSGAGAGGATGGDTGTTGGGAVSPSPTAEPSAPSGPTLAVTRQSCNSGKLVVTATANHSNAYRKGIASVLLERQNEYGAWISGSTAWLGSETGQGNQWSGTLPGNTQNIGKTLRVTATSDTGATTVITTPVTAPC